MCYTLRTHEQGASAGAAVLGASCAPLCRYFIGVPALIICWQALVLLLCTFIQARLRSPRSLRAQQAPRARAAIGDSH